MRKATVLKICRQPLDEAVVQGAKQGNGERPKPALPACAGLADLELVGRAVKHIRQILNGTVARGMEEVGAYLLKEFYADDPAIYQSSSPGKHASLRMLEERCETMDLPVKKTFLANAIRLAVLSRTLPERAPFLQLPPSHRVELLKVKAPETIEQLALRALEQKATVRNLRELVRKERDRTRSTRGRKPTPAVLRALAVCIRELGDDTTARLPYLRDEIAGLTEAQVREARVLASTLARRVEELVKLVG